MYTIVIYIPAPHLLYFRLVRVGVLMLGNLPPATGSGNKLYFLLGSIMYLVNARAVDYYVTLYADAKGYAIIMDYMNCAFFSTLSASAVY